ncbi:MAG: efflux RND transporter periplasmic adaptor subunit [Marinilabiliales bacterium]|nr:MAG: efflux RND transporter periplasmic adaptor subunit [Marinilabiliales bacterium]
MKTKYIIILILAFGILSCKNTHEGEGSSAHNETEHENEGIVFLSKDQIDALDLKTGHIQKRNLTTVVKLNGQLEVPPSSKADITSSMGGNIKQINVFHGDMVNKGQVVAVLEHPDFVALQEDFAQEASHLQFLESEFKRQKTLYDNNVASGKEFQKIKAEYNSVKAKVNGLKARLKLLNISTQKILVGEFSTIINILSPISGYVSEIKVNMGSYLDANESIMVITDNSQIHADFLVYENDVQFVKKDQLIHFEVANQPDKEYIATIFAIGMEFEKNTRAVHIHAKVEDPKGLIPGMYISGHLHTDKNYVNTIPDEAIVSEGSKSYIFIALDENEEGISSFKMEEVIPGLSEGGFTEIKYSSAIKPETKIAINSAYYLFSDLNKESTEHNH